LKKLLSLLIILSFTLFGCSEKHQKTEGYILDIEKNRLLIAEKITADEYSQIKNIPIPDLIDQGGLSLTYFSHDDDTHFQVGDRVIIWFNGNVATSYPGQAGAIKIKVIE
jgi:hypothetical protein